MIETKVEGTPSSVRAAATFLTGTLKPALATAAESRDSARSTARSAWDDDGAAAYRDFTGRVLSAADEVEDTIPRAAEKINAYARKLEWLSDRMRERRATAVGGGLTVAGTAISRPDAAVPPADLPAGSSQAEADAWDRENEAFEEQKAKVELYNEIGEDVDSDWDHLESWVAANLDSFYSGMTESQALANAAELVAQVPGAIAGGLETYASRSLQVWSENLIAAGARTRALADEARRGRRSGNPARRARANALDHRALRRTANELTDVGQGLGRIGRAVPVIGGIATVALAANDIAGGASPSTVGVSNLAGIGGGADGAAAVVGGAALIGVGAPVIAVAAGAVVVGVGASMAAEWVWENAVSQEFRDAVDEGLRDFGNGVKDVASDTWDKISFWD